jgi:hypothetical protein
MIQPRVSSLCAVLIPTQKTSFSDIETFCLTTTLKVLDKWDTFFIIPDNIEIPDNSLLKGYQVIRASANHFMSLDTYNRWLLGKELYTKFLLYDRILISQADAIVIRDELDQWARAPFDIIGAPWFGRISISTDFRSRPDLNVGHLKLEAGNGGLCMMNPRAILDLQRRHPSLIAECARRSGNYLNQDVIYSYLAVIDPFLKVADLSSSARFSLELNAREYLLTGKPLPMGFHALFKYDSELWHRIFPQSPVLT